MQGWLEPIGPEEPRVYWMRRAIVLAVAVAWATSRLPDSGRRTPDPTAPTHETADAAGTPGAVAPTRALGPGSVWFLVTLVAAVALENATTYWSTSLVLERTGQAFSNDPWDQLRGAAGAVFGSWMNDRAIVYRRKYNIPTEWGTAVNVQAMVFGNTGDRSGSGVAFTRSRTPGIMWPTSLLPPPAGISPTPASTRPM